MKGRQAAKKSAVLQRQRETVTSAAKVRKEERRVLLSEGGGAWADVRKQDCPRRIWQWIAQLVLAKSYLILGDKKNIAVKFKAKTCVCPGSKSVIMQLSMDFEWYKTKTTGL